MRLHVWCRALDKYDLISHHAGATGASDSTSGGFQDLIYLSLSGMAPAYLAADFQLVSAAFYHIKDVCCQTDRQ